MSSLQRRTADGTGLIFDVRDVLHGVNGGVEVIVIDAPDVSWIEDAQVVGHLGGDVEVQRVDGGLLAKISHLQGTRRMACSRCLTTTDAPYSLRGARRLYPVPPRSPGFEDTEEVPPGYDPVRQVLDLRPFLREEILLSLPDKPLCHDACRGLCPHCGADRNRGACGCPEDTIAGDPSPLAGLKDLWSAHDDTTSH